MSIVNPARIVAFRKSEGGRTKTDKQDAKLIAHFCAQKHPVAWVPTPQEFEQLQVLLMRLESLPIRIQTVKKRFHAHIEQHETLQEKCALLISLPGIAELSAARWQVWQKQASQSALYVCRRRIHP